MQHLFIYSTLRTTEGHPLHNYLRGLSDFVGKASIGGIKVELDGYVGLLPSRDPNERVTGELYRIHEGASEKLFEVLDAYEGCGKEDPEPHEFFRHRQDVMLDADGEPSANQEPSADKNQKAIEAWVYLYNG